VVVDFVTVVAHFALGLRGGIGLWHDYAVACFRNKASRGG